MPSSFRGTQMDDKAVPTGPEAVFGLLVLIQEMVAQVRSSSVGYRDEAIKLGFSPTAAEQMAVLYHMHCMNMVMKAVAR